MNARLASLLVALLAALAVLTRVLPHAWNATPLVAVALFAGARLARAWMAAALVVAALLLGDVALGLFPYDGMAWVYGASVAIALAGRALRTRPGAAWTLAGALGGGFAFYAITNFGVWAAGTLYPRTLSGLAECYVAALPFYRNQVIGDVAYTAALFGLFALATRLHARLARA